MQSKNAIRTAALAVLTMLGSRAGAVPNYIGTPNPIIPTPGIAVPAPDQVIGKEFASYGSSFFPGGGNITVTPEPHVFKPLQVTAWDANQGAVPPPGMGDSSRYFAPYVAPAFQNENIDELANHVDLFYAGPQFRSVVLDTSALLFSTTGDAAFGSGVGGAPIAYEKIAAAGGGGGIWATPNQIAHAKGAGSPLPNNLGGDLGGLEVWGLDGQANDDGDRFSLYGNGGQDPGGVAVWAQTGGPAGAVNAMVTDLQVAQLIAQFTPGNIDAVTLAQFIDLDGLMMDDTNDNGQIDPGEGMLFSVRPIAGVFDGGEIWDTDFTVGGTNFLFHGGHVWDTAFDVMGTYGTASENVDGLEAVAMAPEPGCVSFIVLGAGMLIRRKRVR